MIDHAFQRPNKDTELGKELPEIVAIADKIRQITADAKKLSENGKFTEHAENETIENLGAISIALAMQYSRISRAMKIILASGAKHESVQKTASKVMVATEMAATGKISFK